MKKILKIETLDENVQVPFYAHKEDAGMDIRANEDVVLNPGETKIIKTGFKLSIPIGYEVQIRPRSGLSYNTPLIIPNSPGTIDSGYKDEIGVIMRNTSREGNSTYSITEKGCKEGIYEIRKGDRIAQMVLNKIDKIEFELTTNIAFEENNRGGGFGHSGVN